MLSAHITSFLNLINAQLEETSRGISSSHHFHNVQCGIANILSLLKYSNDVGEKADQLSRTASNYIACHAVITEGDITKDADRLKANRLPARALRKLRKIAQDDKLEIPGE